MARIRPRTLSCGMTDPSGSSALLEPLEARRLLASDFASVGMVFISGANFQVETFATEGFIDDEGRTTGTSFESARNGRVTDEGLEYSRINNLADYRFTRSPDRGRVGEPDETNGAQFRNGPGWFYAQRRRTDIGTFRDRTEFAQELELIVDRPDSATLEDIAGAWRFSLIGVDDGEPFNGTGTLNISGSMINWVIERGSVARPSSTIDSVASKGLFITTSGEYFYLSRDGQTLIFADMSESDGIVSFGMAVRADATVTMPQLAGGYLLAWAVADPAANDIRDEGDLAFAQRFLDLEPDGDYFFYDLDEYDDGRRNPISRGRWTLSGNLLTLTPRGTSEELNFIISDGGQTLLPTFWDDGEFIDAVAGIAVRAGGPVIQNTVLPVAATAPQGGADLVYALRQDGRWFVTDVAAASGSPAIAGDVVAWEDPKDGNVYAAGTAADGSVILFTQDERGTWTFRNLTLETARAQTAAGDLEVMIAPDGQVNLVGLNASGEVVRFYQTGSRRSDSLGGGFAWAVMNISAEQLAPAGMATPAFEGDLVAYATSWGGLNIAGLDAAGDVWSVWWAPGAATWQATNLSEQFGTPTLAGGLTVYLTPWNGINIAGVDPEGRVRVTWWVPQFVDQWFNSDLTEDSGGPLLRAESLASFVSSWGGLNVAGIDRETGEVVTYWWSPARVDDGWASETLTRTAEGVPEGIDLGAPLTGAAGENSSLNVFARTAEGELARLFWEPGFGPWRYENVTDVALPA